MLGPPCLLGHDGRESDSAEDGDQDQNRGDLKGQKQFVEENAAQVLGRGDAVAESGNSQALRAEQHGGQDERGMVMPAGKPMTR